MCGRTGNMSFLDIKDPAERALVKEYVTALKTVKQRNMAIGDELQTLFHPIANPTKQVAEETRKVLEPMKRTLTDIDGALALQRATGDRPPLEESKEKSARPQAHNQTERTFGFFKTKDGHLVMGDKVVGLGGRGVILYVEDEMYDLTPGLNALITYSRPQREEYTDDDYTTYRALVAQTTVKPSPNHAGSVNPYRTWKWKHCYTYGKLTR